jgi:hypothetical protein
MQAHEATMQVNHERTAWVVEVSWETKSAAEMKQGSWVEEGATR